MSDTIRAVIDTGALVPSRQRRALQEFASDRIYVGVWSPWIIAELNRVLTWHWIRRSGGNLSVASERQCARAAKVMMDALVRAFELVHPLPPFPPAWPGLRDEWDRPIWATAVEGRAHYVVSDNFRDFPPADGAGRHSYREIECVRVQNFLNRFIRPPAVLT